jgi:hypothetical protein
MRLVRERTEARWLPSRHRYALARLFAFLMLRRSRPGRRPGLILAVDRDQSTLENLTVGAWAVLTTTAYLAAPMRGAWKLTALPLALIALQLPIYLLGAVVLPLFGRPLYAFNHRFNSTFLWVLLILASSYVATAGGYTRFVAYAFFVVVGLNALAAAVLFLMRGSVAAWEQRCGG